ncbi:MAG: aminotransferase class V-fold PLP-dependent enzyme [Planctomycetaceae bacterium]|nr:aminotransferase class V-fold PLP-dependent enzyme [Planctomycetaceae bacterium]
MSLLSAQIASPVVQETLRREMPVAERWSYFDHAAVGPLTRAAAESIKRYLSQCAESGDVHWPQWAAGVEQTRSLAAAMIGALPEEIALVHSTTEGISLVAEGLDWRAGDNVVLPAGEFPTNVYPWLHLQSRGVEVRQVTMPGVVWDYQRLADACDQRTRLISCSWVGYANGFRCDPAIIGQIARRVGAYFLLDAIQGLGVFPLDVKSVGVDFLSADGHKWMLSPEGAGMAYIRHELLDRLRPMVVGWNSVVGRFDFQNLNLQLRPEAARYEPGTQNMIGQLAFGGSLRTLCQVGLSPTSWALADQVLQSVSKLSRQLQKFGAEVLEIPEECRSGIVMFQLPGLDATVVRQRLLDEGVVVSCRGGRLRAAVHAYNDDADIDRLTAVVEELLR